MDDLTRKYPWITYPLIVSAPMRLIALAELSVEVSAAGGIGFLGTGNDQSNLEELLSQSKNLCEQRGLPVSPLSVGVGFLNWGADIEESMRCIEKYKPCAIWMFAPRDVENLVLWTRRCREVSPETHVWIQVGGVEEAKTVVLKCRPDVLVVQGGDAGGHGLNKAASIVTLVPEIADTLAQFTSDGKLTSEIPIIAAGGISDGRSVASALALGASGVCMGTRFLAAKEAAITKGYRDAVLHASDGGQTTGRSSVYDRLRGTTDWPEEYGGRGVLNQSYHDAMSGMPWDQNTKLYQASMKLGDAGWGTEGRMTTYAGTGVGLVKKEQTASEIMQEVQRECLRVIEKLKTR